MCLSVSIWIEIGIDCISKADKFIVRKTCNHFARQYYLSKHY